MTKEYFKIDMLDLNLIRILRNDARKSLRSISRFLDFPLTTLYNRIKKLENNMIEKYTSVLNQDEFSCLHVWVWITLKDKSLPELFYNHTALNSLFRVGPKRMYAIEMFFKNMKELERFNSFLKTSSFQFKLSFVIEEFCREKFFT